VTDTESDRGGPDQKLDALRQQLRSLGYLDAGVDRFLLAPARGSRGPIALAARSSIRVGLLGGILLGPAAALGLGGRLPGLISSPRDAVVLAVYLGLLFLIALAVTAFVLSAGATAIARPRAQGFAVRAAIVSRAAGWLIATGCLLYLTFWWRNANAGFGWSAPVWTAFALVVAVGISLLLGHAVRITTLAVLAAGAGGSTTLPPVSATSWTVVVAGGALAFVGAAALLGLTASADSPGGPDHPPLTVVHGASLRVVAIDGFDPAMAGSFAPPLAERFAGLRVRLQAQDTSDPARAWTTIATGEPPDVHGVRSIETRRVAGVQGSIAAGGGALARTVRAATDLVRLTRPSVASRDERRSKTVWEVAEDAGLRTAVVNWWATWPAPAGTGIVITDRAVLRLEHAGALDGEIAPSDLYPRLREAWPAIRQRAREAAAARFTDVIDSPTGAILRRSAELDATIVGLAQSLPGPARDLDVVYLPGLDIAQHALLATQDGAPQAQSAVAARVEGLRAYYQFLREVAGPLLTPGPRTPLVLLMQPGRVQTPSAGVFAVYRVPLVDEPAGTRDGGTARVEDIAPTLLNALGVPLSRELPGQVVAHPGSPAPPRFVPTYGRPFTSPVSREGRPLDQEMIDRLRSLGYVK
jgi:hypothetical protein